MARRRCITCRAWFRPPTADKELLDYRYCAACVQQIQDDYDAAASLRQLEAPANPGLSRIFARRDGRIDFNLDDR